MRRSCSATSAMYAETGPTFAVLASAMTHLGWLPRRSAARRRRGGRARRSDCSSAAAPGGAAARRGRGAPAPAALRTRSAGPRRGPPDLHRQMPCLRLVNLIVMSPACCCHCVFGIHRHGNLHRPQAEHFWCCGSSRCSFALPRDCHLLPMIVCMQVKSASAGSMGIAAALHLQAEGTARLREHWPQALRAPLPAPESESG